MDPALRLSARSSVSPGLACLALCLGCSSSSSDDGSAGMGGGNSSAGTQAGGTSSAGSSTGGASTGGGHSGGAGSGGASTGGAGMGGASTGGASTGGKGGHGGGDSCQIIECFRDIACLDHCGGTILSHGCCACVPPTVDQDTCGGSSNQ